MALSFSIPLANAILDAIANGGTSQSFWDSAIIQIRSGTKPTDADQTVGAGTLLAELTLPADAMAAASSSAVAKSGTWSDSSADATGTASWFRIKKSGDAGTANNGVDKRIDGTITVTGGGGDMTLDNVSIAITQPVTITSYQHTLPH